MKTVCVEHTLKEFSLRTAYLREQIGILDNSLAMNQDDNSDYVRGLKAEKELLEGWLLNMYGKGKEGVEKWETNMNQ